MAEGTPVTVAAFEVGDDSASAFSAAFRRSFDVRRRNIETGLAHRPAIHSGYRYPQLLGARSLLEYPKLNTDGWLRSCPPAQAITGKCQTGCDRAQELAPGAAPIEQLEPRALEAARLLKLLANEQRLTVLCRLSGGEMSVTELGEYVALSQSALSQHSAKLRADGIVSTRRDAQTIYYRPPIRLPNGSSTYCASSYGGPDR